MKFARCFVVQFQAIALLLPLCIGAGSVFAQAEKTSSAIENRSAITRVADCIDFINDTPPRVSCGFIDLPVNHDNPAEGKITLPILIAGQTRSLSAEPSQQAILIPGGGGPGASIGFGLPYQPDEYLGIYSSLRSAGFDLVILDQRGAGFAKPALRCPETVAAFKTSVADKLSFEDSLNVYRDSLKECRNRLESQNIPLTDFDTYQSAKDYLAVMSRLPYQWWGVIATSYATVIAQEMAVQNPSIFDRIVLDSPVAIDYQRPFTFELIESSIQRILSLCEITHRCNRRYKNVKTRFREVLLRLKKSPVTVEIENYDGKNGVQKNKLQLDDITLLDILTLAAYSNYSITEIPWIIDAIYKKKYDKLKPLAAEYWHYNSDLDFSSALSWMIHCKERQPLEEDYLVSHPAEYANYSKVSKAAFTQERLICSDWHKKDTTATRQNTLITTESLIIAGDLDPVISRSDIKNAADNFTRKKITILPGTGHSVWFQSACTRENVVTFFSHNPGSAIAECKDGIRRFK